MLYEGPNVGRSRKPNFIGSGVVSNIATLDVCETMCREWTAANPSDRCRGFSFSSSKANCILTGLAAAGLAEINLFNAVAYEHYFLSGMCQNGATTTAAMVATTPVVVDDATDCAPDASGFEKGIPNAKGDVSTRIGAWFEAMFPSVCAGICSALPGCQSFSFKYMEPSTRCHIFTSTAIDPVANYP
eukprot:gene30288-574_t